jgi:hypothetical protein
MVVLWRKHGTHRAPLTMARVFFYLSTKIDIYIQEREAKMARKQHSRKSIIVAVVVSILVILLAFSVQITQATMNNQYPNDGNKITYADDQISEVGVEWVDHFPGPQPNTEFVIPYNDNSCDGLYNRLTNNGWTPRLYYTELEAWERDAKAELRGGTEDSHIDQADIGMICTSGTSIIDPVYGYEFPTAFYSSIMDDHNLIAYEAKNSYGDTDLEWLAFDTSNLLLDYQNWANAMYGLHLLLGFSTTMHVNPVGDGTMWSLLMMGNPYSPPYPITSAWFTTVDWLQPEGVCARVLYEYLGDFWNPGNLSDHLWGKGYVSPDTYDQYYGGLDHCSAGGFGKRENSSKQLNTISMPIVNVLNREVNENYVQNTIAPAFNLTGEIGMDDMFYYMTETTSGITYTLQVDRVSGSYNFHNLSKLWTTPVVTPTLPSELDAANKITLWFNSTPAEGLPAMQYRDPAVYEYSTEDIVSMMRTEQHSGDLSGQELSRLPIDVSMIYPRSLSVAAGTTSGFQMVDFPMVGPGARMKIYLGDGNEIIGVQGGSRDVQVMSQQVTVLDPSKVWESYLTNPNMAIGEIPIVADYITYTDYILGYYEMPYIQPQNQLIPVYDFSTDFYSGTLLVAENVDVYLPAAVDYLPPQVAILSPEDGATFWAGEPISFEGWINHGTPPYIIEWTSSSDGYLGNTINIVAAIGSEVRSNTIFSPTVSLQVTDANGLTATHTISLAIKPVFWLPLLTK